MPRGPRVELEVLLPAWARHGIIVDRFLREGESAMRIRSEHAVRVLDEGLLENGVPYLVLEQVEGHTLQEIVATCGRLPLPTVIDWVLQATEAIAQAHSYGIVHGDLTPAKMFLTRRPDGTECIKVDFGVRKLAEAPRVDVRPDVRALGAVLDVLLTGRGSVRGAAWRTRLPRALEDTVRRCSSFVSVAELARALAPFGTPAARVSRERIECLLEDGVRELVPSAAVPRPRSESPPRDPYIGRRPYGAHASGRVVLLALVILTTLGASTFAVMYDSVPRGDARASIASGRK